MIPSTLVDSFTIVNSLVADFSSHERDYLSHSYQEAEARKDFIDKFFIALGWDVNHDKQKNPYEQEVKVERSEGASKRRADYAFRIAPRFRDVVFFVEASQWIRLARRINQMTIVGTPRCA